MDDPFPPDPLAETPGSPPFGEAEVEGFVALMRARAGSVRGGEPSPRERAHALSELARASAAEAKEARAGTGPTNYTTSHAQREARRRGWRVLERERYDARTRRHHDLMLGADLLCESPGGIVAVQAAGRGERALHRRRFEERGGSERAGRLRVAFVYWEFERGSAAPVREEAWA